MNKKILIGILLALILVLIFSFVSRNVQNPEKEVKITTDRTEYGSAEVPRLTIKNNLTDSICLSDCYPYYLEIKKEEWERYLYEECEKPDLVRECIASNESKDIELIINASLPPGLHRVVMSACLGCQIKEDFKKDLIFQSNEFTIGQ